MYDVISCYGDNNWDYQNPATDKLLPEYFVYDVISCYGDNNWDYQNPATDNSYCLDSKRYFHLIPALQY